MDEFKNISIEIEEVVGGFKITAELVYTNHEKPLGEAYAAKPQQIPTRIKTLLDKHFSQEKAS